MLITTLTIALAMIQIKGVPVALALAYFVAAAFVDSLFFGASLKKVPHGAWFPLGLAVVILFVLTGWAWAKGLEDKFDAMHRYRLSEVLRPRIDRDSAPEAEDEDEKQQQAPAVEQDIAALPSENGGAAALRQRKPALPAYEAADNGASLARLPVFALCVLSSHLCWARSLTLPPRTPGSFHNHSSSSSEGAPHSFTAFVRSYPALPQVIVRHLPCDFCSRSSPDPDACAGLPHRPRCRCATRRV